MLHAYDLETYSDRYELEQAYRLECNAEIALENAAASAVLDDLEHHTRDLLERLEAHKQELERLGDEQHKIFEDWLA